MKWKQYFKLPFKLDDFTYVWDANNQMVIDFPEESEDIITDTAKQLIVNCINYEGNIIGKFAKQITYKKGEFFADGEYAFQIRSWDYLTSPNCCNLSNEEACKVQDSLGEYILNLLN